MRKIIKIGCGILVLFLLAGCGSMYTGDYDKYADALSAHSASEAARISNQADAIMQTVAFTTSETKTESTLLAVIAMMQIERLTFQPLGIVKPTTGMDVLNTTVGYIPFVTMGMTTYKIAERGFEAAGNVTLTGETVSVSESFNPLENHATGDSNTASVPYRTVETIDTTTGVLQ